MHGLCRWGWHGVCAGGQGRWLAGVTGRGDWAGVFLPGQSALPPRETPALHASISTRHASPTGTAHAPRKHRASPDTPRPLTCAPAHDKLAPPQQEEAIQFLHEFRKPKARDRFIELAFESIPIEITICRL